MRSSSVLVSVGCFSLLVASACTPKRAAPDAGAHDEAAEDASGAHAAIVDAGAARAGENAAVWNAFGDAGTYTGALIGGLFPQTPIMNDMEWPLPDGTRHVADKDKGREGAMRIGYIRQGGKVPVLAEAHPKANCLDGWYELVAGGFVCGKYATLDLRHPRVRLGPHPPNLDGPLPYEYGYNLTNGTPIYRSVPSREERKKLEPWIAGKPKAKPAIDTLYAASMDMDAGTTNSAVLPGVGGLGSSTDPLTGFEQVDAGIPWYLRDFDGGKPQVTLDELRGEGPIVRRMVRGFYLGIDREVKAPNGTKWWRTTAGFVVPQDRIFIAKPLTDFHGVWLNQPAPIETVLPDGGIFRTPAKVVELEAPDDPDAQAASPDAASDATLPTGLVASASNDGGVTRDWNGTVAFVLYYSAHKYVVNKQAKSALVGPDLPRFTVAYLTGQTAKIGGIAYSETIGGYWMRDREGVKPLPGPAPRDLAPGEKWIDVNLTNQTLVAFEGKIPVYATLISSGRRDMQDPDKDHPTVTGSFRIREKHVAATMDGDVASDGPYSIEDVPWIMYFQGSFALHGAFWHAQFGRQKSHGCVNLSPADARTLFAWTDPPLPLGWHGVMSTPEKPGTRIVVHCDSKEDFCKPRLPERQASVQN